VDRFNIAQTPAVQVVRGGSCPEQGTRPQKRTSLPSEAYVRQSSNVTLALRGRGLLDSQTYGPLFTLNFQERFCPLDTASIAKGVCRYDLGFDESDLDASDGSTLKRDLQAEISNAHTPAYVHALSKRSDTKTLKFCSDKKITSPRYYNSGDQMSLVAGTPIYSGLDMNDCVSALSFEG
jgi:hypothetical protein